MLAVGDAPETIEGYSKQQLRWATGGFEILLTHNPLSPRRKLSGDQRIQYFVTAMFYLTGRTSVVAIIRDVQNAQPTLATAWNVTNTFILALFVGAAARDAR